jgi:hypothetical protein
MRFVKPICIVLAISTLLIGCTPKTTNITKDSIKNEKNKTIACLKSKNFQSKLTNQGIAVEIKNETLLLTNTTKATHKIKVNRGFKRYKLAPQQTEQIHNIIEGNSYIVININA